MLDESPCERELQQKLQWPSQPSMSLNYQSRLSKFLKINVHEAMVFWKKGHRVNVEIVLNGIHEVIMLGLCETPMYLMMDG